MSQSDPTLPEQRLDIVNSAGVPLRLRLSEHAHYGWIVRFYDRRHTVAGSDGQVVSYYDVETLRSGTSGISLESSVPGWFIDAGAMQVVRAWLTWLFDNNFDAMKGD